MKILAIAVLTAMTVSTVQANDCWPRDSQCSNRGFGGTTGFNVRSGQVYPGTKAGVINPRTGEFYPKAGPRGYLNPRTGEFYPGGTR